MQRLYDTRPHIVGFYRTVESSLEKKHYDAKPQGRISDGFIYILSGKAHYQFADYGFDVSSGEVMFLSKGSLYSIDIISSDYRFIFVDFDFSEFAKSEVFSVSNAKSVEAIFRRMLEKWRLNKPLAKEECMSLLYSLYVEVLRADSRVYVPASKQRQLDNAVQYIAENLANEAMTVEEIAAAVGVSESHFRRLFKSVNHISPIKYITLMRIDRAKELIRYTATPISQIALDTGFAGVYYFSRIFKKEVGCTPTEYRDSYSEYQT